MRKLQQLLHVRVRLPMRGYQSLATGAKYTTSWRQYLKLDNGSPGSYFHDVLLNLNNSTANMVVEVPRFSNAKFEISTALAGNPIVQDIDKFKECRYVPNLFPYHGYIHNYGALPQTWEDPTTSHTLGIDGYSVKGDNDPLDCCEIGSAILKTGDVRRIKILGSIALIDDGELDWKIIVIDVNDPIASQLDDINDVDKFMPGLLRATREWFRDYKIPTGKSSNEFAYNANFLPRIDTLTVVQECHESWKKLISGAIDRSLNPKIPLYDAEISTDGFEELPPAPIPEHVNKWYYGK